MRGKIIGVAVALATAGVGPGSAQAQVPDGNFIAASCSGAAFSCAFTVQQVITSLRQSGVSPAVLDAQIAGIVAIVAAQVGPATPPTVRAQISAALAVAADNTTDPVQAAEIATVSQAALDTTTGTALEVPPTLGSPA